MKKKLYTYNDPWELIDKWVFPRCFGCDSNAIYDQTIHLYRIDENSFGLWHHLRSGLTAVIATYAAIFGMLAHLNAFWTIYSWIDIFWLFFFVFLKEKNICMALRRSSDTHHSLIYLFFENSTKFTDFSISVWENFLFILTTAYCVCMQPFVAIPWFVFTLLTISAISRWKSHF